MPAELFANTATTTLSAAISSTGATSTTVTSSALFPAAATGISQFRVLIDAELMIVTNVSGTTWTITRGAEGSTAATHLSGATVTHTLTAGAVSNVALSSLRDRYLRPTVVTYETQSRASQFNTAQNLSSQNLYLVAVALPAGLTVSTITFVSASTAAATPTNWWFALHDNNRVQLATTADQTTTAWASNTAKTLNVATIASGASSTFVTTYEGLHYLGLMMKATTVINVAIAAQIAGINTLAPILFGNSDPSLTTPPTFPRTAAAITVVNGTPYAAVG